MAEVQEARNNPHIKATEDIKLQIEGVRNLVKKDAKFDKIAEAAKSIVTDIRNRYSNREMALVITKMQEASNWAKEKDADQTKAKLTEAMHWCDEYVEILKIL